MINIEYIDMQPYLSQGQRPSVMMKKLISEQVLVPVEPVPLGTESPGVWSLTKDGDTVRVPVLPYMVTLSSAHESIAGAFTLLDAIMSRQYQHGDKLRLIVGMNPYPTDDSRFVQVWLGAAIVRARTR